MLLRNPGSSIAAIAIAALIIPGASNAQAVRDLQICESGGPENRLAACTRLVDAKNTPAKTRVIAYVNRGRIHYQAKELASAIENFKAALKLDSNNLGAYMGRAEATLQKWGGWSSQAVEDLEQVLRIDPKHIVARVMLSRVRTAREDYDKAIKELEDGLRLNPRSAELFNARGDVFQARDENDKALADYAKATEVNPKNAQAFLNRAMLYGKEDVTRALRELDGALRIDPRFALAHHWKGYLLANTGQDQRALEALDEAARLDPASAATIGLRADILRGLNRDQEALATIDAAIRLAPDSWELHSTRAKLFMKEGKPDLAIRDYSTVIQIDPRNADTRFYRAEAFREIGEYQRAILDYREALRLAQREKGSFLVHNGIGLSLQQLGDYDGAVKELSVAIELNDKQPNMFVNRGIAYDSRGDLDLAIQDFSAAIALSADLTSGFMQRGLAYLNQRKLDLAYADFTEFIRIVPATADGYLARGKVLYLQGNYDPALSDLNEAVRLSPDAAEHFLLRSVIYRAKGDLDLAVRDAEAAMDRDRNYASAYIGRGEAYRQKGLLDRAIMDFAEGLRLNPDYTPGYAYRGLARRTMGNVDGAISDFQTVVSRPKRQLLFTASALEIARQQLSELGISQDKQIEQENPRRDPANMSRVALVIGNGKYQQVNALPNPTRDAGIISETLRSLGFKVIEGYDLDANQMRGKIAEFGAATVGAGVTLMYYAGHGLQVSGKNYMIPVDARLERPSSLVTEAIELGTVLSDMESEKRVNLVFLDACRENQYPRVAALTRSGGGRPGLAAISAGIGTLIAFATSPDTAAMDGEGVNSPFTAALVKHIRTPELEVRSMLTRVRVDVISATKGNQVPWDHSSLTGEFYFGGHASASAASPQRDIVPLPPVYFAGKDGARWQAVEGENKAQMIESLSLRRGVTLALQETIISKKPLPFFPGYDLVNVTRFISKRKEENFFLWSRDDILQLDGTNDKIYFVSDKTGSITRENAAEYLKFFFQYVPGAFGPMAIIEEPADIVWLRTPEEKDVKILYDAVKPFKVLDEREGVLSVEATFFFKECLFNTKVHLVLSQSSKGKTTRRTQFPGRINIKDHALAACGDGGEITAFHAFGARAAN